MSATSSTPGPTRSTSSAGRWTSSASCSRKTTTDAKGAFSVTTKAPQDFGGIHDVYAVVDGKQVAKGGFLVSRVVTMTPTKGPLGTPITITVSGLGSSQYESEAAVLYDNHYTGLISGNTTRGTATVQIRAAGAVGRHTIEVYDASHILPYLNIEQSPLPWLLPSKFEFTITRRAPAAAGDASSSRSTSRRPVESRTTLGVGAPRPPAAAAVQAELDERQRPLEGRRVRDRARARSAGRPRVGDGRRQPGQLHGHVLVVGLGSAREGNGGRGRLIEHVDQRSGRARRLARRPPDPERTGGGGDAVLRQPQLRLDHEAG